MQPIRINKYLAASGYASRRAADEVIKKGKVYINNIKAVLGDSVKEGDLVQVSGKTINPKNNNVYLAYNKPVGIICTADLESPNNIISVINYPERIFPVGRLDVASSGLIFLTNDGDFTNRLTHPKFEHEKEYYIALDKSVPEDFLFQFRNGIKFPEGIAKADKAEKLGDREIKVVLHQGWRRQIRRMCEELGYQVKELQRIRIGKIELGNLATGTWRVLTKKEVKSFENK